MKQQQRKTWESYACIRFPTFIGAEFGRLDILINNAGISIDGRQLSSNADLGMVKTTFETNVFGVWRLCKTFLPLMQRHGYGRIVNISSGLGAFENLTRNRGRWPGYSLSKASLNALTVLLATELQNSSENLAYARHSALCAYF